MVMPAGMKLPVSSLPLRPVLFCCCPRSYSILVPTERLELSRLSPPPPQDGVSTNFTTSAGGTAACELDAFHVSALLRSYFTILGRPSPWSFVRPRKPPEPPLPGRLPSIRPAPQ